MQKKSFCANVMFAVLVAASAAPVNAECPYLQPFREAGEHHFTVHGAFCDLVLKTALHEFVKEHLPNSPIFKLGSEDFDLQDLFIALSDALAEVLDGHFMGNAVDYSKTVRHACVGHAAHKLWVAFLGAVGVSKHISDDVKEQYNKYGKAWFSKAFAISVDKAVDRIRA